MTPEQMDATRVVADPRHSRREMEMLALLHRFALERTGWRAWFRRWVYHHEPLRNDAANMVRRAGYTTRLRHGERLVGGQEKQP